MAQTIDISVIICTYNRCDSLRSTLKSFCSLVIPDGGRWELLVVDNNSSDQTRIVCEEYSERLPLRYVMESRQGKSHALNTAVELATGSLLMFTDDDVEVDCHWLANMSEAAHLHPECGFYGGRIIPKFDSSGPEWFKSHSGDLLAPVVVLFNPNAEEELHWAIGANMAIWRTVFERGTRFRTDVGPKGDEDVRGEETALTSGLFRQGRPGRGVPNAIVYHRTNSTRMNERYVRRFFRGRGIAEVRLGEVPMLDLWFGVPRYYWKVAFANAATYVVTRWLAPSGIWLAAEIRMAMAWGTICECRRRKDCGL